MGDEKGTFQDVMDRVLQMEHDSEFGEGVGELAPVETPAPDPEPDPVVETATDPAPQDTPVDKPTEGEGEGAEASAEGETEAGDPEVEGEPAVKAEDTPLPDDDLVVGQDDEGNPVTLGELRKGNLRQSDYSRKTAELADQRRGLEERQTAERSLTKLLVTDEYAKEFAELFPQHVETLFEDPENSLALVKDRDKFAEFVKRVNALDSDPSLAEAYVRAESQQSATQQLETRVKADEVSRFARTLAGLVDEVGKEEGFAGVDPNAVMNWLMDTAGADVGRILEAADRGDPMHAYDDFAKLAALVVRSDGDTFRISDTAIRDRFDVEAMRASKLTAEQAEHNKKVEEKLDKTPAAPAATGDPAGDQPVEKPKYKSLDEFLNREGGPLAMG